MKNPLLSSPFLIRFVPSLAFFALVSSAQAQLTWDPDGDQTNNGGNGTWDTSTINWDDNGSAPNVIWTNGSDAVFGSGTYQVDLTSAGVTVGDLTYGGSGVLTFKGSTASGSPGDLITINSGGATWDTGGGEIEFFNDGNNNNTRLSMTSGDTLTVAGGGTFDTGQNPQNNANGTWQVSGAILDVTAATILIGDTTTVGAFASVQLAGGSKFVHERNTDRTLTNSYANNWELGAGTVSFDNRWARDYTLTGDISGAGGMKVDSLGNNHLVLEGANTFTGGLEVSAASQVTVDSDSIGSGDITLSGSTTDGTILRLLGGVNLGSRDLILNGAGGTIVNAGANSLDGNITGSGSLQVGNAAFSGNTNVLTLNGTADHTGDTNIFKGSIALGADNALSSASVLTIGGTNGGTSQLIMAGFDAEIAGLTIAGSNTRQLNGNAAGSVLTINVADGESYEYSGNVVGTAGNISLVKSGLGTQIFNRSSGYSADIGGIAANAGTLVWDVTGNTGSVSVASGATLQIGDGNNTGGIGSGVSTSSIGDANIANDGTVSVLRDSAFSYDGVISGSGAVTYSAGSGDITLSQVQTYTGLTTVDKAVLVAQSANALSADSAVTLGGGGSGTSALDLNGFSQEIGGLAFEPGSHTREIRNNGSDATLTLNVASGESYAFNANFAGSGTTDIVKTGDGTQIFGRGGTYTTALGDVTVNGGELVWNNNNGLTQTGTVSVGTGGTLSGSGVLGGAVTIDGILSPGSSPGMLTFNDTLTLTSLAVLNMEISGTGAAEFDILANDGGDIFTAAGILAFNTAGYTAVLNDTITLFSNWGGFAGSFDSITGTDLGGGLSLDTTNLLINGTVTVVPEPSTALFGGLGLLALLRRRRK